MISRFEFAEQNMYDLYQIALEQGGKVSRKAIGIMDRVGNKEINVYTAISLLNELV